jgi:hypothetical protein
MFTLYEQVQVEPGFFFPQFCDVGTVAIIHKVI